MGAAYDTSCVEVRGHDGTLIVLQSVCMINSRGCVSYFTLRREFQICRLAYQEARSRTSWGISHNGGFVNRTLCDGHHIGRSRRDAPVAKQSASIWLPLSHGVENTQLITTAGFNWSIRTDTRS